MKVELQNVLGLIYETQIVVFMNLTIFKQFNYGKYLVKVSYTCVYLI